MKLHQVLLVMAGIAALGTLLCTGMITHITFSVIAIGELFIICMVVPENPEAKTFSSFRDSVKA